MAGFDVDVTEVLALAADLRTAADEVAAQVRPAVAKAALEAKQTMQTDMRGSAHFAQGASSISYDLSGNAAFAEARVGPTKGGAGSLANIAYFGGANGGGGTVRDPLQAAEEGLGGFEAALTAIITDLL